MTQIQDAPWITDPHAYRKKLAGYLADRNPLEVLSVTPDAIQDIVDAHPSRRMRMRPFAGKWTPNEIIGHLTDCEWVYGFRLRMILCEDDPVILGMDQDRWVSGQRLNDRDPRELADLFRILRHYNLRIWKQLTPAELRRVGHHNERGEESLEQMLQMLAGHDLSHLDQITRYLDAIETTS